MVTIVVRKEIEMLCGTVETKSHESEKPTHI
jgi:hypothetical protein